MNQKMKQVVSTCNLNYKFTNYNIQTIKRSNLHSLKEIKFYPNTKRSKLKKITSLQLCKTTEITAQL
jgi:hypothetical protein